VGISAQEGLIVEGYSNSFWKMKSKQANELYIFFFLGVSTFDHNHDKLW